MTAFEEGVRARVRGLGWEYNPYLFEKGQEWWRGWREADKGDDCENGRGGDGEKLHRSKA